MQKEITTGRMSVVSTPSNQTSRLETADSTDPVESDGVKETVIQAAICEYLAARRVFFCRQNN
jgi:hypothetical protein